MLYINAYIYITIMILNNVKNKVINKYFRCNTEIFYFSMFLIYNII